MPIADIVSRLAEIQTLIERSSPQPPADPRAFSAALTSASAPSLTSALPAATNPLALLSTTVAQQPFALAGTVAPGASNGTNALAAAESQVGQSEQPPGSNNGPALDVYRTAVAGAGAGQPWCATFVSWAAAQAGAPIGDGGAGSASVAAISDWASRTGRLMPASSTPSPGDLILFGDRHIGIVESVNADGSLTTVEGNHSSAVSRVQRSPSEATGYVRL